MTSSFTKEGVNTLLVEGYCETKNYESCPMEIILLILDFYRIKTYSLFKITLDRNKIRHKLVSTDIVQVYRSNKCINIINHNGNFEWIGQRTYGDEQKTKLPRPDSSFSGLSKQITFMSQSTMADHTFIQTTNSNIMAIGSNHKNQCGTRLIQGGYFGNMRPCYLWSKPELIQLPLTNTERIINIQCSDDHSLFLSNSGNVYGCGDNHAKQLLIPSGGTAVSTISLIPKLEKMKVIDIGCTASSSFVIDEKQGLYGFGYDIWSWSERKYANKPCKIVRKNKIDQIKCGYQHVCLLDMEKNKIITFGENSNGECGRNVNSQGWRIEKPSNVYIKSKNKFLQIFVGYDYTFILDDVHNIYVFGNNDNYQCLLDRKKFGKKIFRPQILKYDRFISKVTKNHDLRNIILTHGKTYFVLE